jgi:hypothetical protein
MKAKKFFLEVLETGNCVNSLCPNCRIVIQKDLNNSLILG